MAWRFRKSIKVIPGVKLNFSKSGISTSIGVRGASVNFSKSGTYINVGIPGTGLSSRHKLLKSNPSNKPTSQIYNPPQLAFPIESEDNIFSADVQEITSQDMQGIKETILAAHTQRNELKSDSIKIQKEHKRFKNKLLLSYIFLYGLIIKSISNNIKKDIHQQEETLIQIQEQINNSYVELEVEFEPEISQKFNRLTETFKKLSTSQKIWDVTSAHQQDTRVTRSSAGTLVNRREVKFGIKSLPDIKSSYEVLWLSNANGTDMYIYPNFIVMHSSELSFAIIGLNEIELKQSIVRFTETDTIPADSKIIDKTWFKVNKNGSPDMRFKGNYQIPVVRYGEITLKTKTGLNEEYKFSNYEYSEEFGRAFIDYQDTIKTLNNKS